MSETKRLRIFDVAPEDAPVAYDEAVGRFRSGRQDADGNPVSLDQWRVTTGDPAVADEVAALFGGDPAPWDTSGEEVLEVLTEAPAVDIILEDGDSIKASMVLMSADFKKIRECDGIEQSEDFGCADCVCPSGLKDRKAAAKAGTGCKPNVAVYFKLAAAPELGKFRYFSGAWGLLEEVPALQEKLDAVGGPALVEARLRRVSFTAKDGTPVSYVLPRFTVKGEAAS